MKCNRVASVATLYFLSSRCIQMLLDCLTKFLSIRFAEVTFDTKITSVFEFLL